ncbi:MAG: TetR/AcrR family transcriptional regulator [Anaerolineae bacterium]|nr:TetR/AcrR family transcriptional regulator [Anaerolineae bacterium]
MSQPSLRERNKQKVTQRIVEVTIELFKTKGYRETTMDEIAEQAEISRKTLFNYFPSKESLLLPWGQEILDNHLQAKFIDYMRTEPTTAQLLHFIYQSISELLRDFPDVAQAFARDSFISGSASQRATIMTGVEDIYLRLLRYGQARGEVRSDIPLEYMTRYLGAFLSVFFLHTFEAMSPENASQEIEQMLTLIQTGLSPAK